MSDSALQLLVMFICNAAETGFILLFHNAFLGVDRKHSIIKKYLSIWIVSFLLFFLILFVAIPTALRYVCVFLVYFGYALFYQGSLYQKLLSTFAGFFLFMCLGTGLLWIESLVSSNELQDVFASQILAIVNETVLLIVGLVLASLGPVIRKRQKITSLQWGLTLFYPLVALIVLLSLWQFSLRNQASVILLVDAFLLMAALCVHYLLVQALSKQNLVVEQEHLLQQQLQIENEKAEALNQA